MCYRRDRNSNWNKNWVAFDDSSSTQIAIAIIKSVGDYDINEYAVELGRKWGRWPKWERTMA